MDTYEKKDKLQVSTSMKSPSKLRMKQGISNINNSSRTTPSDQQDSELANYLLAPQNGQNAVRQQNKANARMQFRMQQVGKSDACSNPSSVHPVRVCGDDILDYDSTSSFEFFKGEKYHRHSRSRHFSSPRPMPSKWNDAEKWIVNKKNVQLISISKKNSAQNRVNLLSAPEFLSYEFKPSVKRGAFPCPASRAGQPNSSQGRDVIDVADAGVPARRSAAMRDMGTEMTPIPSLEPSRSPTPVGATTPLRSPTSSLSSSPQTREPALIPTERPMSNAARNLGEDGEKELSEQEMKHKVTREIVALGVHLGKMNIVAWASKDERERNITKNKVVDVDEGRRIEYRKRAAAWEQAEKSKHEARFKRQEMRVEAWASRQRAKSEAEARRAEARIEQMRAKAQAKIAMKMASARRRAEEKRASAEATKNRQHKKTAAQAKYICQTGRIPSTFFSCYWWFRRSRE